MQVMIVDDSVVVRSLLRQVISAVPEVSSIETASNGKTALEKLKIKVPDLMILDMEMPELDGMETLNKLKSMSVKTKVIIFASETASSARRAMDAFRLGASDIIAKPVSDHMDTDSLLQRVSDAVVPKVQGILKELKKAELISKGQVTEVAAPKLGEWKKSTLVNFKPKALVIASSTGGPDALNRFVRHFRDCKRIPILIAQHMPPVFTKSLADDLSEASGLPAAEGVNGEIVKPGRIYVAPGDWHMSVNQADQGIQINLDQTPPIQYVRPAANKLMTTAAALYGKDLLGVVLTGMGEDGKDGAIAIKQKNGVMLIQDQASSVVWGMPGAVHSVGAFDKQGNLEELGMWVRECIF